MECAETARHEVWLLCLVLQVAAVQVQGPTNCNGSRFQPRKHRGNIHKLAIWPVVIKEDHVRINFKLGSTYISTTVRKQVATCGYIPENTFLIVEKCSKTLLSICMSISISSTSLYILFVTGSAQTGPSRRWPWVVGLGTICLRFPTLRKWVRHLSTSIRVAAFFECQRTTWTHPNNFLLPFPWPQQPKPCLCKDRASARPQGIVER